MLFETESLVYLAIRTERRKEAKELISIMEKNEIEGVF
jgi:hypothetical protein